MKDLPALVCVALATATTVTHAQLLHDDFSGNSLNTSLWQNFTPFSDSSVSVVSGQVAIRNRGKLLTVAGYTQPLDIRGRFTFTGSTYDNLRILTRSDGLSTNPWSEFDHGLSFTFRLRNGDWNDAPGNISISVHAYPGTSYDLIYGNFPISVNTPYDFRLTDDGFNAALYITDLETPLLTAQDGVVFGSLIALYNREGSGGGSSISAGSEVKVDYLTIVPEPSALALCSLGLLGLLRRRH